MGKGLAYLTISHSLVICLTILKSCVHISLTLALLCRHRPGCTDWPQGAGRSFRSDDPQPDDRHRLRYGKNLAHYQYDYILAFCCLEGTVPRDFRLQVFFMNQFPPSSWWYHLGRFEFFRKFAEIFAAQGAPPVSRWNRWCAFTCKYLREFSKNSKWP